MAYTGSEGTLIGPLTTTFTPPATCTMFMSGFAGQSCISGKPNDNGACWPASNPTVASPTWPFIGWGFYSPGLICPTGFTTACTAIYGERPDWEIQFNLYPSETAVGCCPHGFTCTNRNGNTCVLTASRTTSVETVQCDGNSATNSGLATFPALTTEASTMTDGDIAVSTFLEAEVLYAPMFQLNFKSSDLTRSTSSPSSSAPTTSSNTSSNTSSASSASSASATANPSSGLSSGAKAGIGVGVSIAGLLILGTVILLLRRRGASRGKGLNELPGTENKPPLYQTTPIHELDDATPTELPAQELHA